MTAYEKFLIGLLCLYLLAHMTLRWGLQAGVPRGVISLAESMVTR